MGNIFYDIGLIIIVATFLAYLAGMTRQPLVLAYIIGGIIIGPVGFRLISNTNVIMTLAEIGIAFFLFIVGLEMNITKLRRLGKPILLAGLGQIIITFIAGYLVSALFFDKSTAVIISLALTFSSTMIVVKLLSDKREIDTLHGRIIIGILLIQDIVAIFALSFLQSGGLTSFLVASSLVKGILLISVTFFVAIFVIPWLFKFAAKSQELLFISAVAWLFIISIFSSFLGFSFAIGAFIAGISLAQLDYSFEIVSKVRSLRDFFSIIFFVALGMMIIPSIPQNAFTPLVILTIFVVIGNPLIVLVIMGLLGFSKKPAFLTGMGIGQASEFSLILATQAFVIGRISQSALSVVAIITAITLVATSYLIKYDSQIYSKLSRLLSVFEFRKKETYKLAHSVEDHFDAVLFGCDRIGYSILSTFRKLKYKFLVVDFNPEVIHELAGRGISCIYGDFDDAEIMHKINLKKLKLFISTIPDFKANARLIRNVRNTNKSSVIFVTAVTINEALELYEKGADYVIMPHFLGGEHTAYMIEHLKEKGLLETRKRHIEELKNRKLLKQEHPGR
jgi:Kef-type K+ transport system membrane component KefB